MIERELGTGGMATVYLARDLKHDRNVALKVLKPELGASLGPERFLREIQVASRLQHPHILPVHDSGEAQGILFYVMPYVEGESLRDRLRRERQLPIADAAQITREIADALAYAHSRNVVHRDIKPANVLLQSGHAIVADFGIARAIEAAGSEQLTQSGMAMGTPAYMSPEQAAADLKIDGRSDIYSLGCVLYEMLGGEPPHTGPSPQAILARQLSGEIRSLRPLRATVSPALERVIRRALAPAAADRYSTALDFATAVEAAVTAPVEAAPAAATWQPAWRRAAIALAAVGVLGAAAYLLVRARGAPPVERGPGIAVFPFRPTSSGGAEWSEALGDLLATALDGTPGVRVADPWSLWQSLRRERGARAEAPDPDEAERLARGAQAETFVLGSVLESQARLDLTVRLYRAGTREAVHTIALAAPAESLTTLVHRVALDAITWIWKDRGDSVPRVRDLEGYTTRSPSALKAYLEAKEAMRRGLVDDANAAIDRALALDSAFALALVYATGIKSWWQFVRGQPFAGLFDLAQRAGQHADSLSERNRLRAEAALASIRTDGPRAMQALSRIVELDSTDFEAWSMLAYVNLVYGWQHGRDASDALDALERMIRLDPRYVPGLAQRAWLAEVAGDRDELRNQLDRLSQADTSSVLARGHLLAIRALLADDSVFQVLADTIARRPRGEIIAALRALRPARPDRTELLVRRLEVSSEANPLLGLGEHARLMIAEGRTRAADSAMAAGEYRGGDLYRAIERLLVAASLAGLGDSAAGRRAVDALARYVPAESALAYFENRPAWWVGWLVGAWHAEHGDTAVTRRWHRTIATFPAGGSPPEWRAALQSDLEARLASRRGDADAALAAAHRALESWSIHTENQAESMPEPHMRLHLAVLLRAANRGDSAAALLRSLIPPTTWMGFLTARALYELAGLAEAKGDLRAAAGYYDRALVLWRRGGPEISAWRDRAEEGLERVLRRIG